MRLLLPPAAASLALVAALLAAAGCAPAISGLTIETVRTEARVKTALVNDPIIGARVINVRMSGRVAQLSGRVASAEEAARAIEIARVVTGVGDVQSLLVVGDAPDDAESVVELRADPQRGPAYEVAELEDHPHLLALGGAMGWANQAGPAAGTRVSLQPLVALGSGPGLGPAIAFEWFEARVASSPDAPLDAGAARLRPFMAGVRYLWQLGRVAVAPSLVAGYSINRVGVPEAGTASGLPVEIANSFVWRPGVSVGIDTTRRTMLHLSIGRAFTDPRVTFVENGRLVERAVSADTSVVLVGFAYRLF
ncbi:MAG: BON domain-containing protein [Acidobacteriota bacterium]